MTNLEDVEPREGEDVESGKPIGKEEGERGSKLKSADLDARFYAK